MQMSHATPHCTYLLLSLPDLNALIFLHNKEVSVPDGVRELCSGCFRWCKSLRRVTFGPSSSLERIGDCCFQGTAVEEVAVPDGVRELGSRCFKECRWLRRVTFGPSSSLEWINTMCFMESGVEVFAVPDGVRVLGYQCFFACRRLRHVTFGPSSSLEQIGSFCFRGTEVVGLEIPPSVRQVGRVLYGPMTISIFVASSTGRLELVCSVTEQIWYIVSSLGVREDGVREELVFEGEVLPDSCILGDFPIEDGATVDLVPVSMDC